MYEYVIINRNIINNNALFKQQTCSHRAQAHWALDTSPRTHLSSNYPSF